MNFISVGDVLQSQYLTFELYDKLPKTNVFRVFSTHDQTLLGMIRWNCAWRKYVYDTDASDVIWSIECLKELTEFIEALQLSHSQKTTHMEDKE